MYTPVFVTKEEVDQWIEEYQKKKCCDWQIVRRSLVYHIAHLSKEFVLGEVCDNCHEFFVENDRCEDDANTLCYPCWEENQKSLDLSKIKPIAFVEPLDSVHCDLCDTEYLAGQMARQVLEKNTGQWIFVCHKCEMKERFV